MVKIKHTIARLYFEETVPRAQTFEVEYRMKGTEAWIANSTDLYTDNEGVPEVDCIIEGLDLDTEYEIKLTNVNGRAEFIRTIHTALDLPVGESPLYLKKVYVGQTLDLYVNGLLSSSLPPNYDSFYFILEANYRDAFGGFKNAIPDGGMKWDVRVDKDDPNRRARGASLSEGRYIRLNDTADEDSRINGETIFGDGNRDFSMFFWFYTASPQGMGYLISYHNDQGQAFSLTINNAEIYVGGADNTAMRINEPIEGSKWYCIEIVYNHLDATKTKILCHGDKKTIGFSGSLKIPAGDERPIYIGASARISDGKIFTSEGLTMRRLYYAKTNEFPDSARYRLLSPEDYLPKLIFTNEAGQRFTNPQSWVLKLDDSVLSTAVDPEMETGSMLMAIETPQGTPFSKDVEVLPFSKRMGELDVDFEADFDNALETWKNNFYGFTSQWGGANGGTVSELVYANRGEGALVFEQHGDTYDGDIQGVSKPYKNNQNTGYGAPLYHTIPDDPKFGEPWRTRVGSVAVSKDYCGFGEWSTWMKVPVGCYGVAPALWFFHYQEIYDTDERWQKWIDKGGKPYGGSDPYMVINHEIDMELPSHLIQGSFAEWGELGIAYFDPKALDTQYRVGIETATNPADRGLFRLTNPSAPNSRASWVKESDTWDVVSKPHFSNCKFNNWIGEKSSGNGWAYDQESYNGEEYLALMTKLDQNFADDEYHKWTIKWFKDRTELWIDDVFIRANKCFVPYIPGRLTFGGWFPSGVASDSTTPWEYSPVRAWAGYPADWKYLHLHIKRIKFTPYTEEEAGGANELYSETYPETGLRLFT